MPIALNNFSQELQNNKDKYSTDYQLSNYQNIETLKIINIVNYLFGGFYLVVIVLCYFLYMEPTMSYKIKWLIIILFALYPFYIYWLEQGVYYIMKYIYCLMTGTIFKW
jgi:hypothetical protein